MKKFNPKDFSIQQVIKDRVNLEAEKSVVIETPPLHKYEPKKEEWSLVNLYAVFNQILP